MKTSNYLFLLLMLNAPCLNAQKTNIEKYISKQLSDIENKSTDLQEYKVILKWQNLDAINGNKLNCNAVKATYIVGLDNGYVGWKNVSQSKINNFQQEVFNGRDLQSFNNFSYKAINSTDFLKEDFYKDISPEQRDLAKWLVSDAIQMQGFAWYVFDSLSFNKVFRPKLMENNGVKFENWVSFSSRYQKLIWSGITKFNNEICAIIKFESLYNPVEMNQPELSFKGRSLYWGEMWISLEDKQVEYATMVEDVIFEIFLNKDNPKKLIDLQREVTFTKN